MRIKFHAPWLWALVLLLTVETACTSGSSPLLRQSGFDQANIPAELSRYKTWHLVNPEPVVMSVVVAQACVESTRIDLKDNPHLHKFISVYVNEVGRHAMLEEARPRFPIGSMIVKEKLSSKTSASPELLTAMVKREQGYDPRRNDWEYLVLDGSASKIKERGKLQSCQACHLVDKETDYVSRIYLSDETRKKLGLPLIPPVISP